MTQGVERGRARRLGHRVELALQQARVAAGDPQPADAQRRVRLVGQRREGQRLVRSGVQRPQHDLAPGERLEDLGVALRLLRDRRLLRVPEEGQLGAEQPDALGVRGHRGARARAVLHVGQHLDGVTVPRRAPARRTRRAPRRRSARPRPAARASAGSGSTVTVPCSPSSSTVTPAGTSSSPPTATTQGSPSWRAMIAVWLVVPPSRVASPMTRVGSSPAVSAGARSSASSTDGTSGLGTPGSPWPVSSATIRSRTSRTSVTRSAISPPSAVNMSTNCCAAWTVATAAGAPASIRCSTVDSSPRSRARPAVVDSTSALTPGRRRRAVGQPAGHDLCRGDEPLLLAGAARPPATSGWSSSGSRTAPDGRMTGPRATPGHHGRPGEHERARRGPRGRETGHGARHGDLTDGGRAGDGGRR